MEQKAVNGHRTEALGEDRLFEVGLRLGRRAAAGALDVGQAHRVITHVVARSSRPPAEARSIVTEGLRIGHVQFHPHTGVPYVTRCLANVQPVPIQWLRERRFAVGKLNLIAGQPGLGKSQITAWMAGIVTRGGSWPDGTRSPTGSVVFVSCEDDAGDTNVPRLDAVGADRHRVHILDWIRETGEEGAHAVRTYNMGRDVAALGALCSDIGDVRLVVVDPVSAIRSVGVRRCEPLTVQHAMQVQHGAHVDHPDALGNVGIGLGRRTAAGEGVPIVACAVLGRCSRRGLP